MDVAGLRDCISSTLQANADIRRHAELQLKQAEQSPGFIGALINIVESEPDLNIKLSAVVYLKNKVTRSWEFNEDFPKVPPVPEAEKPAFRERLIPILASSPPQIRGQLLPLIGKILHFDFPQKWPSYMDITLQLLNANEIQSVFAGLQCLLALCRVYRYKSGGKRDDLDTVTAATFGLILSIGNRLVQETSTEAGEMLKLILKIYKHAIYYEMAAHLREELSIVPWATLFINVVGKEAPPESMLEDLDEREQHPWWKAKKWAYSNLNRLFVRYGNPAVCLSPVGTEGYKEFSRHFINHFAPEILKAYLHQIDLWVAKRVWLSKICLSFIVAFMDECVKPKVTWQHLRPHVDNLVAHVLFPLLCQTDEDLELFETDPAEYLHRKINFLEEVSAPDVAATNFLVTITRNRRKTTFTVLNFVNEVVNRYEQAPENEKNYREKEGALRMIGTLAAIILGKKSPIANNVEYFFVRHVFPEFRSPHGYLRARACDVLEKFSELDFHDHNNIVVIYQSILQCLQDPALPVRVEAALALQPLIRHEFIRTSMQENIPQIMQQLLKLTNEVDVDALANVMEEFVEVFASELTPFAVELTEQLRDTYLRIVSELMEKSSGNPDEETFGEYLDDKSITALGVLQTIGTLILTLESTPEVLLHLENVLVPVITITLENKLFELYNEVFEIIDSCTFSAKSISPTMWMIFELIHKTFKDRAEVYVEDMLPSLDNYITYGAAMMRQNPTYLDIIVDIIQTIFTHERLGAMDRICGCKLAEAVMLNLRGGVDKYLSAFIEIPMQCLINPPHKLIRSYQLHLMEMVINCVYYNPIVTLQVLEQHGWTNKFFSLWFSNIDNFTRVHDKKLSIVAIASLLQLRPEQIPQSIQPGWHRLLQGSVRLFETLPMAMKNREEISKEGLGIEDDFESDDGNDWENDQEWGDDEKEESDVPDENSSYIEFLNSESAKIKGVIAYEGSEDDGEELEEESMLESPLDNIEPYIMFRNAFFELKAHQPQLYENLTKTLNAEEQTVIGGVIEQANLNEAAAAATAAAMGLQANGN